ncbi:hypothetical protein AVEN_167532-1 [Araneus ventricosus]|uniref:Uncharacterized protein n=1 Tax=Araneus ventricosus TaxID=182803 RepID=A0A4Y2KF50_ARAVE|nr:hypothetical protein AVEN_167532-1 [Araneus ventricosus]
MIADVLCRPDRIPIHGQRNALQLDPGGQRVHVLVDVHYGLHEVGDLLAHRQHCPDVEDHVRLAPHRRRYHSHGQQEDAAARHGKESELSGWSPVRNHVSLQSSVTH